MRFRILISSGFLAASLGLWLGAFELSAAAAERTTSGSEILHGLRQPPRNCTQVPFWFWNGPLEPEEFKWQLREMADKGVYAAMPHPRFGMDRREYLEEPFWTAMAATLKEARRLNMQIWLYDEYNWPSGGAGGRVTEGHPELYPRGLDYVRLTTSGPRRFVLGAPTNTEPRMEVFEKYLLGFLRRAGATNEAWSSWGQRGEKGAELSGDIGEGDWEVLAFFQSLGRNPSPLDDGSNSMTDYLSEQPLRRFLALTHEQYYARFKKYFGNVIPAVFSDESSTTAPAPFPWTDDFAAQFERRCRADLLPTLPELLSEQTGAATRLAYWQTVADLYGGRHLGNYAAWCRAHGVKFTGHVYEENIASYAHAPQLMNLLRTMDFPGFDALGPTCTPAGAKAAVSVAHLERREEALCENMGLAGGWNCTLEMLRRGYNTLGWLGVSRFVPHAFFQTVENPRVECPPSFFQNPYWKYYRAIADLSARLSYFNRLGTHVAPCAVYYPIESLWADSSGGKGQGVLPWQHKSVGNPRAAQTIRVFNELLDQLATARWDLDVVDDRALSRAEIIMQGAQTRLKVGPEEFRVLIVPPVSAIGGSAIEAIDRFVARGGCVVWLERFPETVWPPRENEPRATLDRLFPGQRTGATPRTENRQPVLIPADAAQVVRWLEANVRTEIPVRGELKSLRVSHRRVGGTDLYLLFNDSGQFLKGEAALNGAHACALVDMDSGKAGRGDFSEFGLKISLRPGQSAVAVCLNSAVQLPPWRVARPGGEPRDLTADWEIQVAGDALDSHWRTTLPNTHIQVPLFRTQKRDFQKWTGWERPEYSDAHWQPTHALRGHALFTDASPILFRVPMPPGARTLALPLPVTGEYALWINGTNIANEIGPPKTKPQSLPLSRWTRGLHDVLALETTSHSGPAGLTGPLEFTCGPVRLDRLRPWNRLGLGYYTGRVLYRKRFTLDSVPRSLWLDLGQVQHYAEVYLNGKLAGPILWPPYEIDVTAQARSGENELVIVVANSIANRFAWDQWGTRGSGNAEPSGLIGPVRLWRK